MREKIQRYTLLELFTAKWGQCDVEWCKASDIAPLEARIEELERNVDYWKSQEEAIAIVCFDRNLKITEQAEEIERLKRGRK